jgi:outer membrane protein assembly factor BamB
MTGLGRPGLWGILGVLLILGAPAQAQFGMFNPSPPLTPEESLFRRLPREPRIQNTLEQLVPLIEVQNHQDTIDQLQEMLDTSEDFFDVDPKLVPVGSLLDRVEKLLLGLPPEALEVYRRQYDPLADQLLKDAQRSGVLTDYLQVACLFPPTQAALTALREAADLAHDAGEPAVAARLRERLLSGTAAGPERTTLLIEIARDWTLSGQPELAQSHVKELSELARTSPLEYQGKLLTPPETGDAAWLNKVFGPVSPLVPRRSSDWRGSGGHPRRWADGPQVSSLQRGSWSYPLIDRYDTRQFDNLPSGPQIKQLRHEKMLSLVRSLEDRFFAKRPLAPQTPLLVGSPLVVRDTALVQGVGTVKAIDLRTGQLRWSGVVLDNTFLYWAYRCLQEEASQVGFLDLFLGQRVWLNQTSSALASDGQRVYSITGTGMFGLTPPNLGLPGRAAMPRSELSPANENRLLAYDIQTGLFKWELGGADSSLQADPLGQPADRNPRLTGAYFLGAPLAVEGQLYVMAEERGQIRLFALTPETGDVEWSIPLVNPSDTLDFDIGRRISGLTPTYAGGLLICPTGEGVVVTIDPLRRRVKWIHQYQTLTQLNPRARQFRGRVERYGNDNRTLERLLRERRWFDSSVLATAGRVLVPAADDHKLICLELETGKPVWTVPRGDGLFIAASTGRHCLVAGERTIQSIRLADGKVVWSRDIPTPAGRGVLVEGKYLLPASTGEVLAIEVSSGKIVARLTLAPSHTAGTLIAAGDQLLMQTASELVGFRSLSEVTTELTAQLQAPTPSPLALAEQGELLLIQGREAEAITLLRESLKLQESDSTRKLLVWSLLDRLKSDFNANRKLVSELKEMVRDSGQRKLLTRLNAEGLEQAGEYLDAFREHLQLVVEVGSQEENQVEITPELRVREDRWLRGRLTHLYLMASPETQAQMQVMIREAQAGLPVALRKQFASVIGLDLAPQLHLTLALEGALEEFLSKRVLWTLSESNDLSLRGPAIARLVREDLGKNLGQKSLVATLVPQLEQELADVMCEPGLTGQAFLNAIRADAKLGKSLEAIASRGLPEVVPVNDLAASTVLVRRDLIPALGPRRGVFDEWSFSVERNSAGTVWCSDPTGRDRFSIAAQQGEFANDHHVRYVQTDAQLALLVFRDSFAVVYPHEPGNQTKLNGTLNAAAVPGFNMRIANRVDSKPAVRDKLYPLPGGNYLGNVGPLLSDTLVYQTHDGQNVGDLIAAVPYLRKQEVWRRSGLPIGCEILADAHYVVLIPPQTNRLIVLRTSDGVQVAERALPARLVERKRAEWGRLFLTNPEAAPGAPSSQTSYAMYDPVTDKTVWSRTVPKETLWTPVNGSDLAFLEPDGKVTIVDYQTGAERWSTQLPEQSAPASQFQIHADHQRLYLHTWTEPSDDQEPVRIDPTARAAMAAQISPVNGLVAALDRRSGQLVWSRTIPQQMFRDSLPIGSGLLAYSATRQKLGKPAFQKDYSLIEMLDRQTGETVFQKSLPTGTMETSWKLLHNGVLRVRLTGHDFDLSWNQPTGTPEQSEPIPEPDKPNPEAPIKLQ